MATTMTAGQAVAAAAEAAARRDTIQANLLELDASFGKRLLAGAALAGQTRQRWADADRTLARTWEIFTAYCAVVDQAGKLAAGAGRQSRAQLSRSELAQISELLTGASVRVSREQGALAARELTAGTSTDLTVAGAVSAMKSGFASVAGVCAAAESVWNEIGGELAPLRERLAAAAAQIAGVDDSELAGMLAAARASLDALSETVNRDPLVLRQSGQTSLDRLERLTAQVAVVDSRAREAAALAAGAEQRITAVAAAVTAAAGARQDAADAQQRASARVAGAGTEPLPDVDALARRLAALGPLRAAGRWTRLAGELAAVQRDAAAAERDSQAARRAAEAVVERRNELRGRLEAYHAMAGRLGGAEDMDLEARRERARSALWTAPCDLDAAQELVAGYQQVVLARRERKREAES